MDASNNDSPIVLQCAIANVTQHGVKPSGWDRVRVDGRLGSQGMAEGLVKI
jgi:hypothetical protein